MDIKQQAIAALTARINEEVKKANELFNVGLEIGKNLKVKFTLRARSAGVASMIGNAFHRRYELNFNINMMIMSEKAWWHLLDETVSHEVAHIVDYVQRGKSGHDARWKFIHQMMGGSGKMYHDLEVPTVQHVYGVAGQKIKVSSTVHNKIQNGNVYRTRNGNHPIRSFNYVGTTDKTELTTAPVRKGEVAKVITVVAPKIETAPVQKMVAPKIETPKKAANVDTDGKKRYTAPSGMIVAQVPSKLSDELWKAGFTDKEAFYAEYTARGGKAETYAYRRVRNWYVGK